MAEVITLAIMPHGNGNKFEMTDEHKQFYIDNNSKLQIADIAKHIGTSTATLYLLIKEHKLPKKVRVFKENKETFTEFFCWTNATLLDPIQGYLKKHY
jgi:hypothetical protein